MVVVVVVVVVWCGGIWLGVKGEGKECGSCGGMVVVVVVCG